MAKLKVYFLSQETEVVELIDGRKYIAGRADDAHIKLPSGFGISRHHLSFYQLSNKQWVCSSLSKFVPIHQGANPIALLELKDACSFSVPPYEFRFEPDEEPHTEDNTTLIAPPPFFAAPPLIHHAFDESAQYSTVRTSFWAFPRRVAVALGGGMIVVLGLIWGAQNFSRNPQISLNTNILNEQRQMLEYSLTLATNLYVQGKYSLCIDEIKKIHDVSATYKNSAELKVYCEQGIILVLRDQELRRQEAEKQSQEIQISHIVTECERQPFSLLSVESLLRCLEPARELDPDNHLILKSISAAQMRDIALVATHNRQQTERRRAQEGLKHFVRCQRLYGKKQLLLAQSECMAFLSKRYPRSTANKSVVKRQLASIQTELRQRVSLLSDECRGLQDKAFYREAYEKCALAQREDPSNKELVKMQKEIQDSLNRQLKSLYQDSILEESLGNVDNARAGWLKILNRDLQSGIYQQKARGKLQQYGS